MTETTFTKEVYDQIVKAVDELPKEAVESTKAHQTKKGYDTTGYNAQFLTNVLNEVVSPAGWTFTYEIIKDMAGAFSNGKQFYDITVKVSFDILGAKREGAGGHRSGSYADALKGAITNASKKTLSYYGIGKKAYEGQLDDDNKHDAEANVGAVNNQPQPTNQTNDYPDDFFGN